MKVFCTAFSIVVLVALGMYLISFAFGGASVDQARNFLEILEERKLITGMSGVGLLAIGCLLLLLTLRRFSREPSMAFQNPEGEVRVTFSAIEDFIRRLVAKLPEVREMQPQVLATREGLEVYNRIVLEPNINIPDATSRVQEVIKKYIEDVLGIKEIVAIKVLVVKIAPEGMKRRRGREQEQMSSEVEIGE